MSVAAARSDVRRVLADVAPGGLVLVACSGGADSLALADAVAHETTGAGVTAGAVVVDHGLQPGSAAVAENAVVAVPDGKGSTMLVAHIVAAEGMAPSTAELRRFTLDLLPAAMVPAAPSSRKSGILRPPISFADAGCHGGASTG